MAEEPARPSPADKPDADEPSTVFMPTQANAGVSEDERLAAETARVAAAQRSARTIPWRWVALVALVLLAVPLLRVCSEGRQVKRSAAAASAAKEAAVAASAASAAAAAASAALAQPGVPPSAEPQPARPPGVVVTRPQGQPPPAAAEGPRQMVTKCIERGRVVYTQTGECAGSVTAVPIDADKNVVGTDDQPARAGAGKKAP